MAKGPPFAAENAPQPDAVKGDAGQIIRQLSQIDGSEQKIEITHVGHEQSGVCGNKILPDERLEAQPDELRRHDERDKNRRGKDELQRIADVGLVLVLHEMCEPLPAHGQAKHQRHKNAALKGIRDVTESIRPKLRLRQVEQIGQRKVIR